MLKDLVKVANKLDSLGLTKEADFLDSILKSAADWEDDTIPVPDQFTDDTVPVPEYVEDTIPVSESRAFNWLKSFLERAKSSFKRTAARRGHRDGLPEDPYTWTEEDWDTYMASTPESKEHDQLPSEPSQSGFFNRTDFRNQTPNMQDAELAMAQIALKNLSEPRLEELVRQNLNLINELFGAGSKFESPRVISMINKIRNQ